MKTKRFNFLILAVFLMSMFPLTGTSQDYSRDTKISRKEKKETRKAELYANYRAIDSLLKKKTFVLEAYTLRDKYGDNVPVNNNLNFIRVNGSNVVLQTGTPSGMGYNGVGGVTAEGSISNWKVVADEKRLNHSVSFNTTTGVGIYDVMMTIAADATASATITGMTSGRLTYLGNLVAPYNSRVFKGMRTP
jgi:hypothetical protein